MDNVKYYFPFIFRLKIFPQSPIMLAAGSHLFKGKSTSQKRLTSAFSFFTFVSSQLTMATKQELRGKLNSFFSFFLSSSCSAAAQHLRMQNEQASETVAMVIVTKLIVTRILIKAHTATRLPGRPSRWKQQQLMASLSSRVSGHLEDAYLTLTLDIIYSLSSGNMHAPHWSLSGGLPFWGCSQCSHFSCQEAELSLDAVAAVLLCPTLTCMQPELCFKDDMKAPERKADDSLKG